MTDLLYSGATFLVPFTMLLAMTVGLVVWQARPDNPSPHGAAGPLGDPLTKLRLDLQREFLAAAEAVLTIPDGALVHREFSLLATRLSAAADRTTWHLSRPWSTEVVDRYAGCGRRIGNQVIGVHAAALAIARYPDDPMLADALAASMGDLERAVSDLMSVTSAPSTGQEIGRSD